MSYVHVSRDTHALRDRSRRQPSTPSPLEHELGHGHAHAHGIGITVSGKNLSLKPGRHIQTMGEHPAKVVAAAMSAAGAGNDGLGEVRGRLEAMFTG